MAMSSSAIDSFLKRIMSIEVLVMGGASAGIFGISSADNDTVNNLKKSAIAFAKEYSGKNESTKLLAQYSQDIEGYLQVLQLTNTISKNTAEKLTDELRALTPSA
jgi:hypothetical protein